MSEIFAGAAVGLALQVLREAIERAKDRSVTTTFILDRLDATIIRITPLMVQMVKLCKEAEDSPTEVIEDLNLLLGKAVSLVDAFAGLRRRNLRKKYRYMRRIKELEADLRWMVGFDVQVNQLANIKELMAKVSEINTKLDEITRQPTNYICFKCNSSTSQSTNQHIVEETNRSSENSVECSNDGSKPKIDIHIRWSSRTRNKDHLIRIVTR